MKRENKQCADPVHFPVRVINLKQEGEKKKKPVSYSQHGQHWHRPARLVGNGSWKCIKLTKLFIFSILQDRKVNRYTCIYIYGIINTLKQQVTPPEGWTSSVIKIFSVAWKLKQGQKSDETQKWNFEHSLIKLCMQTQWLVRENMFRAVCCRYPSSGSGVLQSAQLSCLTGEEQPSHRWD